MTTKQPHLHSRMVFQLWKIMMVLVLLSLVFIWVVQIFLFEQNYVDSAMADLQSRLEPVMADLKTEDLAYNDKLIPYLSKSTNGKAIILDGQKNTIAVYSYGYQVNAEESVIWHTIKDGDQYADIMQGEEYSKVYRKDSRVSAFEIGIPVTYAGEPAYIILHHSLDEVNTVLDMNRRQLVALSVILTVIAAALAALFSRQFVKPIQAIRKAVDGLAQGDLNAVPGLKREDELGLLSVSVEKLGEALQRVDVLRKEVIANVSHELRSPLALIVGYTEMVRDISWREDAMRGEHLNLIIQEAKRMSLMVDDIMDYSQFQAGYARLNKEWYNLVDIVESEVNYCKEGASEHNIQIALNSAQPDIPAYMDALKISRVIRNLLNNAVNHTKDGETVTVSVEIRKVGKVSRVSFVNPGDAIPEEERELIWERYYRCQHQGGRNKGTGLGLSIVSTILKAHEMPYGVDCQDGLTMFWFECSYGDE